ncbi:MAG: T9SS type A sorting domain-containing protein [Bacteroidota bacterium]
MKQVSLILLIGLIIKTGESQTNLVKNSSFELNNSCPEYLSEFYRVIDWIDPIWSTPDYFNECCTITSVGNVDVPQNSIGFQYARTGKAYAGIGVEEGATNNREYIEGELQDTLMGGKTYYVEFFLSRADSAFLSTNWIGIYFSNVLIDTNASFINLNYSPQIVSGSETIKDDTNWVKISGNFIAQGGEKYLVIGTFKDNTDLTFDTIAINPLGGYMAYYYIDDVYVGDPPDTNVYEVSVFPNPNDGHFTLNYNLDEETEGMFYLYDAIGRRVYKETLNQNNGSLSVEVILSTGVYIWEVRGNKRIKTGKIVVAKT